MPESQEAKLRSIQSPKQQISNAAGQQSGSTARQQDGNAAGEQDGQVVYLVSIPVRGFCSSSSSRSSSSSSSSSSRNQISLHMLDARCLSA